MGASLLKPKKNNWNNSEVKYNVGVKNEYKDKLKFPFTLTVFN